MHPTNRVVRSRLWGVLLAALLAGLPDLAGAAQPAQPPARPPADREVIIPIGGAESVAPKSGKRIADVSNSNPDVARVTRGPDPSRVIILGLAPGISRVVITDEDKDKDTIDIVVQTDVEYLKRMLRLAAPTANIGVIPSANGGVILTGYVARAEDSVIALNTARMVFGDRVVDALHIGGVQQVQLDICVARVDRSKIRQMNFTFLQDGTQHFFASTLGASPTASIAGSAGLGSGSASASGSGNLLLGIVNQKEQFFGFLTALKTEGLSKYMIHPSVTTLSGRPASFLDGGEQAIPVPAGLGQVGVQFEEFGTRVNFLPIVLGNGKIHLEVEPEISQLSAANGVTIQGTTVPGRVTQRVHTTVELEAGQTYVIGGLIQHTLNSGAIKVPVVGDLPFIGAAFRGINDQEDEVEMLIIVTPYLVDAMDCGQLPKMLPGQETRTPDDFELYLEGILEAPRGQREVFPNHCYLPAYKNSPTADTWPCGDKHCGANGSCASGTCDQPQALPAPMPAPTMIPAPPAFAPALPVAPLPMQTLPGPDLTGKVIPNTQLQPPIGAANITPPVRTQDRPTIKAPDVPTLAGKPAQSSTAPTAKGTEVPAQPVIKGRDLPAPPVPPAPALPAPGTTGLAPGTLAPAATAQPLLLPPSSN